MGEVEKLTRSSLQNDYIDLGEDPGKRATLDLSGEHEAEITIVIAKVSEEGKPYRQVGTEITSGPGKGETVYGTVFQGRSLTKFIETLGLDPSTVGPKLQKVDVIGKHVRIRVEGEDRESVGGRRDRRYVVKDFSPLT